MKNTIVKTVVCAAAVVIGTSAFAGEHHHGDHARHEENSGVRLAASIVNLVGNVLGGPSVTVYHEPPAPVYARPVHCPPPPPPAPRHHHDRRPGGHGPGGHGPGPGPGPRR